MQHLRSVDDISRWILDFVRRAISVLLRSSDLRVVIEDGRTVQTDSSWLIESLPALSATITAAGIGIAFWFNHRTLRRAILADERAQASLVSAWVHRVSRQSLIHVSNASPALIYDVKIRFTDEGRTRPEWWELGNGIVRPRTEERYDAGIVKASRPPGVHTLFELWFTDASGHKWIRHPDGSLGKQTSAPPADIGRLHALEDAKPAG